MEDTGRLQSQKRLWARSQYPKKSGETLGDGRVQAEIPELWRTVGDGGSMLMKPWARVRRIRRIEWMRENPGDSTGSGRFGGILEIRLDLADSGKFVEK